MLTILGVPRLPPGGSLGTGKRGTVPKIWRAVPIFLARVNGIFKRNQMNKKETTQTKKYHANKEENTQIRKKTPPKRENMQIKIENAKKNRFLLT